jgi:mono/diheme cytochrome c family protein
MHIVSAPTFVNDGTRFEAREFEQNLYASADAWSAPVAAEVGPDGAVWIADWYCPVLNHNVYRPDHQELGAGNAYVTPDRDREHGRVYRVLPEGSPEPETPKLDSASACVDALSDGNLFWRLTAQRLLAAEKFALDDEGIEELIALADEESKPAALHAFQTLAGVLPADDARLMTLTKNSAASGNRGLAGAALRRIQEADAGLREQLLKIVREEEKHPLIRKEAALALGRLAPDPTLGGELLSVFRNREVPGHFATALRLACLRHPEGFFRVLLEDGEAPEEGVPERTYREALEVLENKKDYLSAGLLALASESDNAIGEAITAAAGASPSREIAVELSESARRGKETYLLCVACHQPEGQGVPGAFPALAGSDRVNGDKEVLAKIILKGLEGPLVSQGKNYNAIMPGHGAALNDRQIADVMNYVRSSWGNDADDVAEDEVAAVRDAIKDRKFPWTVKELETK